MPLVLGPLLIGAFAFFAAIILLGLSQSHTATRGGAGVSGYLDWMAHGGPLAGLFDVAAKLSRAILSRVAGSQLKHVTGFFGALAFLVGYTYKTNANTAHAAADAVQAVDHRSKAAVKQLSRRETRDAARLHAQAQHAEAHARSVGHALQRYKAHANPRIAHAAHAVDVTLPHRITGVRQREEALSRDQAKLRERTGLLERGAEKTFEWIRTHPRTAVTGVFAGAVAIALSRLGLGNLRCRNFRNLLNNWGCGLGTALGDLLGLAAAVLLVSDLEQLAKEMQAVEHLATEGIAELVGLADVFKEL